MGTQVWTVRARRSVLLACSVAAALGWFYPVSPPAAVVGSSHQSPTAHPAPRLAVLGFVSSASDSERWGSCLMRRPWRWMGVQSRELDSGLSSGVVLHVAG